MNERQYECSASLSHPKFILMIDRSLFDSKLSNYLKLFLNIVIEYNLFEKIVIAYE